MLKFGFSKLCILSLLSIAVLIPPVSQANESEGKAELYYAKGRVKFIDEEFESAAELFAKAAELSPQRSDFALALGLARMRTAKYEQAVSALEKASSDDPENKKLAFDLGLAYFETGKYTKAKEAFAGAIEKGAKKGEYYHYLGLTQFRLGDNEEALKNLAKSREVDDSFMQIALYYEGFIYRKMDKEEDAKMAWQMAVETDPKSEAGIAAKDMLEGKQDEGAATDGGYPSFLGNVMLGFQYDTNAVLMPVEEDDFAAVFEVYEGKKDDFKSALNLGITYNPYVTANHLVGISASAYSNFHLDSNIREVNYTSAGGGAQYEYLSNELLFRIPVRVRAGLISDSFDYYSLSYSGSPSFYYLWNKLTLTRVYLNAGYTQYQDMEEYSDRTGPFLSPEVGQYLQLLNNRIIFGLNYRFHYLAAKGNDWVHIGNGGYLTFTYKSPVNMDVTASGGFLLRSFANEPESPVVVLDEKRKDTNLTASLEVIYYFDRDNFNRGFYISGAGQYFSNKSNADFYEYNRILAMINLGANF